MPTEPHSPFLDAQDLAQKPGDPVARLRSLSRHPSHRESHTVLLAHGPDDQHGKCLHLVLYIEFIPLPASAVSGNTFDTSYAHGLLKPTPPFLPIFLSMALL
jgi:hypothetical protein